MSASLTTSRVLQTSLWLSGFLAPWLLQIPAQAQTQLEILTLDLESGDTTALSTVDPRGAVSSLSVAADGQTFAFAVSSPDPHIVAFQPEGHRLQMVGLGWHPSCSPRGTRVCYEKSGTDSGVWIQHLQDGHEIPVDRFGSSPVWSPDGLRIAYLRRTDDTKTLVVYNLVDDEFQTLNQPAEGGANRLVAIRAWSPDGRQILCETADSAGGIVFQQTSLDHHTERIGFSRRESRIRSVAWVAAEDMVLLVQAENDRSPELVRVRNITGEPEFQPLSVSHADGAVAVCALSSDSGKVLIAVPASR